MMVKINKEDKVSFNLNFKSQDKMPVDMHSLKLL